MLILFGGKFLIRTTFEGSLFKTRANELIRFESCKNRSDFLHGCYRNEYSQHVECTPASIVMRVNSKNLWELNKIQEGNFQTFSRNFQYFATMRYVRKICRILLDKETSTKGRLKPGGMLLMPTTTQTFKDNRKRLEHELFTDESRFIGLQITSKYIFVRK